MPDYPDFVTTLKRLHLKRKGNRPKVSPQKFYPSQVELRTQELIREELGEYAYRLQSAAQSNGVQGVYDVPGAVPQGFDEKVRTVAEAVSLFQVRAFANFSELAVGERYFPGGNEQRDIILNTWSDNFINLCKSTNEEMRKKVAGVVSDGVLGGRNIRDLTKDIRNTCSEFTRNKAELIATTEVGKLNTAIARNQSESAGIRFYEWSAAMDGRTRESHAVMDGKICKWGDDDHYYAWETQADGKRKLVRKDRPANAYKGAPGTDFRCRCTALPYVPEYEDDYEAEREKGPVQGVKQGEHAEQVEAYINGKNASSSKTNPFAKQQREAAFEKSRMLGDLGIFKRIKKKENEEESAKRCNPNFNENKDDYSSNCQRCIVAYIMRRRGCDVQAKPYLMDDAFNAAAKNEDDDGWTLAFVGLHTEKMHLGKRPDIPGVSGYIRNRFYRGGDGIYVLRYFTRNDNPFLSVGHVIIADVKNGSPKYIDPQTGKVKAFDISEIKLDSIRVTKTDGFKPSANITDFVK